MDASLAKLACGHPARDGGCPLYERETGDHRVRDQRGQTEDRLAMRRIVIALGVVVGVFFIVRAVVELLTIDYSDPSSYDDDWGGPSIAGVLLVHCGLGLIAALWIGVLLWRRRSSRSSAPKA